jgi:hypothetical protein
MAERKKGQRRKREGETNRWRAEKLAKHLKISPTEASLVTGLKLNSLANRRALGLPPRFFYAGKKPVYLLQDCLDFLIPGTGEEK